MEFSPSVTLVIWFWFWFCNLLNILLCSVDQHMNGVMTVELMNSNTPSLRNMVYAMDYFAEAPLLSAYISCICSVCSVLQRACTFVGDSDPELDVREMWIIYERDLMEFSHW